MVDHYPLFEFAQQNAKMFKLLVAFMLCSFGISTEASAPAVLSFPTVLLKKCTYKCLYMFAVPELQRVLLTVHTCTQLHVVYCIHCTL